MIIQIFGTPCSGKSKFIKEFIKLNQSFSYYDIATNRDVGSDYFMVENKILKNIINKNNKNIILESATGFHDLNSFNIKFSCDLALLERNHEKRKLPFNNEQLDYYSLLQTIEIIPDLTLFIKDTTTFKDLYEKIKNSYLKNIIGFIE